MRLSPDSAMTGVARDVPREEADRLDVAVGIVSERGARPDNQDYVGCYLGTPTERLRFGVIAALADGVGGASGGRVAAETAVRLFIDGQLGQSELIGARRTFAKAIEAINAWLHTMGRGDPALAGLATTLTGVVLRGRQIHVAHVGDSRLYRLRDERLEQMTVDHVFDQAAMRNVLRRALGLAEAVQIDYLAEELKVHDRWLLCSDGLHGALSNAAIKAELARRAGCQDTARALVTAALQGGSGDNISAIVLDVLALPTARQSDLEVALAVLPIAAVPEVGATIDGFQLTAMLSDGRYARVFRAIDTTNGRAVIAKFPRPVQGTDQLLRQAFLREAWIATRVQSPWVGETLRVSPERQTRLYSIQPFYEGRSLESRIAAGPRIGAAEGLQIAIQLARAVGALHRAGIIHRDIKPENVILTEGAGVAVKLIDLGVARLPNAEDFAPEHAPGTPSFMAPELRDGAAGDEASDQFALGVTIYRLFTGLYPYGEIEPFSRPRLVLRKRLGDLRHDVPAWLDEAVARALALRPEARFADVLEFAFALEHGALLAAPRRARPQPLIERRPLLVWKGLSAVLALALLASLLAIAHLRR
jgi:serine/threonine protein phosphatase PrpC